MGSDKLDVPESPPHKETNNHLLARDGAFFLDNHWSSDASSVAHKFKQELSLAELTAATEGLTPEIILDSEAFGLGLSSLWPCDSPHPRTQEKLLPASWTP